MVLAMYFRSTLHVEYLGPDLNLLNEGVGYRVIHPAVKVSRYQGGERLWTCLGRSYISTCTLASLPRSAKRSA